MKTLYAIAYFQDPKIQGTVLFTQLPNQKNSLQIDVDLKGLGKNKKRGFHIHEFGDLSDKCMSMCAHFNPFKQTHGSLTSSIRHAGDLGNIQSDEMGNAKYSFVAKDISLKGLKLNILGRGLIIHEDEDDLGKGDHDDSHITGHAGKRSACAVIGWSKKMKESC